MPTSLSTPRTTQPHQIEVVAPARLHLGFFDLNGSLGHRFGSLGVTLEGLATHVRAAPCDNVRASGQQAERAAAFAKRSIAALRLEGGVDIHIAQALPEHIGLGSGTQLALAVGSAVAHLHGLRWPARAVAQTLGRGRRSGIGIGAFEQGGFLVDGGHDDDTDVPPHVISRLAFPKDWRWILVFDTRQRGLSGAAEKNAFANLPRFPEEAAARLCRLVLMQMLPALSEAHIARFGQAVTELQDCVGDHFALAQGGRYASQHVEQALQHLRRAGAAAIGQTSWGPTGFALAASTAEADFFVQGARAAMHDAPVRFLVCAGRNRGAEIDARMPTTHTDRTPRMADMHALT